jgi:hypothetical protein
MRNLAYLVPVLAVACTPGGDPAAGDGELELAATGSSLSSELAFPDTAIGASAQLVVIVRNSGGTATGALATAMLGTSAGDFSIDAAGSTCAGAPLQPGRTCVVRLAFTPTLPGARSAFLRVSGASAPLDVALQGKAMPAAGGGLVASLSQLDLGPVEIKQGKTGTIVLANAGTAPITMGARSATAPFSIASDTCPAVLPSGGACQVGVRFTPSANGAASGTFTAAASSNTVTVGLAGVGMRRVTVRRTGAGGGSVISTPAGLDCGATCTGLFLGDVTLTAAADADSLFAGWGFGCGTAATCALPASLGSIAIDASFQPSSANAINVTFAGDGAGSILLQDGDTGDVITICHGSCTTFVAPGSSVAAYVQTPDRFVAWDGACSGSDPFCDLGTTSGDREITVTLGRDERAIATLLPAVPTDELAFAPDGDLVVAGGRVVAKLSPSGAVRWSTTLDAPAASTSIDLAVAADGTVYYLRGDAAGATVHQLTPGGATGWTAAVAGGTPCEDNAYGHTLVVAPSGDVGALLKVGSKNVLSVRDAAGASTWSNDTLAACRGLAVSSAGVYHVTVDDGVGRAVGLRFAANGAAQPGLGKLPGLVHVATALDAGGNLAIASSFGGNAQVGRVRPDGTVVFSRKVETNFESTMDAGVAYDAAGNLIVARAGDANLSTFGVHLEQSSPTGASLWQLDKLGTDNIGNFLVDQIVGRAVATDGAGHVAVAGTYNGAPWIEVFAMP